MRLVEIRDGWIVDVDSISEVELKPERESFVSYDDGIQKMIWKTFYCVEIVVGGKKTEISFGNEEEKARAFYDRFLKFCKEKWV